MSNPMQECCDRLYWAYRTHILKCIIQPLHATVSSMSVITATSQEGCEVSFVLCAKTPE